MNASYPKYTVFLAIFLGMVLCLPVRAEDRTAGSQPHAAPAPAVEPVPVEVPEAPAARVLLPSGFSALESAGTLKNPKDGSLGIDLWDGSSREDIVEILPQTPAAPTYRTISNLHRRALLTNADTAMLSGSRAVAGDDLLTLRIEKLTERGNFTGAVALYTSNPGAPFHERFARAGVLAMLYEGAVPVACLETQAYANEFTDTVFWQHISSLCTYLLSRMGGGEGTMILEPESQLIAQMMKNPRFRYTVKSAESLESLLPLEIAVLIADKRMDYSQVKKLDMGTLSPPNLALLLGDKDLPPDFRFRLLLEAAALGMKDGQDIEAFYKEVYDASLRDNNSKLEGWRRLAWLQHISHMTTEPTMTGDEILKEALPLGNKYGAFALLPFAGLLNKAAPESFSAESVRIALEVLILSGLQPSEAWAARWGAARSNRLEDRLLELASGLRSRFSTENEPDLAQIEKLAAGLPEGSVRIITMLYKKLDNKEKLHNYDTTGAYEKLPDLTASVDYVMPSVGLMGRLNEAVIDKRLGEVILLSSIALQGATPDKTDPALLREVLDGFEAVGLTKEAREISQEIILGLGK